MADQEDELKSLKEKNTELVQKVQFWKMTAAQRENEKLELMKEINELRLKVIRLKTGGAAEARKLDAALQSASEQALSHLVQASSAVARTIELAKTYMRDREGLDTASPRWSNISNTNEKVNRVPPMMMGGQSIQPVVSLSRAPFNLNGSRQASRSPNATRNVTVRAVPMHMLQDVYIPLTRIDMRPAPNNETEPQHAGSEGAGNMAFDTSMEETPEEPENMTDDDYDSSRRLDVLAEDVEAENEPLTPERPRVDNPLEGPSWLLDARGSGNFEPDSTTEEAQTPPHKPEDSPELLSSGEPARVFTPTVRRRKRTSTPPRERSSNGVDASRVLQVLVPKMRLGPSPSPGPSALAPGPRPGPSPSPRPGPSLSPGPCPSPAKRRAAPAYDAPSPNGATDSRVIVSVDLENETSQRQSVDPNQTNTRNDSRDSGQRDSGDSDGGGRASGGRTRRNRKPVTYKEKPLNRKLRR